MELELLLIASITAAACVIPGVFLVLRRMALMSDAISHSILPGIVAGFFLSTALKWGEPMKSPLLIIGAVIMSMITVSLTELLYKTKLLKTDAAIGLVFPFLFSVGVIIVTKFAGNLHLDTDAVLLGELALAPLDRGEIFGISLPVSMIKMSVILAVNLVLALLFFKEIKLATFDPGLAESFGFKPWLIHYGLMLSVSVTAVGAFDSVGAILVVALMIVPAAAAYLLTDSLVLMIVIGVVLGIVSSVGGYYQAKLLDASIAGSIAAVNGVIFLVIFLIAPGRGIISKEILRNRKKWEFAQKMLAVHLLHHENSPDSEIECHSDHLTDHINWTKLFAQKVVDKSVSSQIIICTGKKMSLTEKGRQWASEVMVR